MNQNVLTEVIKKTIRELEPDAEIILYGSRSRKDSGPESDWDILILVDGPVDDRRTDSIRHRLYEIEWEHGEVISCIVRNRRQWHQSPYRATPFYRTVRQEGMAL